MNDYTHAGREKSAASCCKPTRLGYSKVLVALSFLLLTFCFNAFSQSGNGTPSCNLSGALESVTTGRAQPADIVIDAVIANTEASTVLSYALQNNTSGAIIKSYGARSFNAATGTTTQQIVVSPGSGPANGFNLELNTTNSSGGSCSCSKSVSVINN
ncbi:MAG: hypothetical protein IPP77_11950 [Bacteroidetes bacterium]|nr:hypothetical protein [Bacteroidota bacterium]